MRVSRSAKLPWVTRGITWLRCEHAETRVLMGRKASQCCWYSSVIYVNDCKYSSVLLGFAFPFEFVGLFCLPLLRFDERFLISSYLRVVCDFRAGESVAVKLAAFARCWYSTAGGVGRDVHVTYVFRRALRSATAGN